VSRQLLFRHLVEGLLDHPRPRCQAPSSRAGGLWIRLSWPPRFDTPGASPTAGEGHFGARPDFGLSLEAAEGEPKHSNQNPCRKRAILESQAPVAGPLLESSGVTRMKKPEVSGPFRSRTL
jgi:hypothetical protein